MSKFYASKEDKKLETIYWVDIENNKIDIEEWRVDCKTENNKYIVYGECNYYQLTEEEFNKKNLKKLDAKELYIYTDSQVNLDPYYNKGLTCGAGLFRINPKYIKDMEKYFNTKDKDFIRKIIDWENKYE